jgi:hypothetical protein
VRIAGIYVLFVFVMVACTMPPKPRKRPTAGITATNMTRYEDHMFANEALLLRKYNIKQTEFETDCIYAPRDLTQLVGGILSETAGLKIDTLSQVYNPRTGEYTSTVRISGQTFSFHAPAAVPRVDIRPLLPQINAVLRTLRPGNQLVICRTPYDPATTILAYSTAQNLEKAVDDGFPAEVPTRHWALDPAQWPEGIAPEITLPGPIPSFEAIRTAYFQTADELRAKGLAVPAIAKERVLITDIFESGTNIDLCIDGEMCASPATVAGQTVRCHWDSWGVLLAYTFVQHFNGSPALWNQEQSTRTQLAPAAFVTQAENAFRTRAVAAVRP